MHHKRKVSVVGLGYVGLPAAVAFGKKNKCIGFDVNKAHIEELKQGFDRTEETTAEDLQSIDILYTCDIHDLKKADFHIVVVPTPVTDVHVPDLTPVEKASVTVGEALKKVILLFMSQQCILVSQKIFVYRFLSVFLV